MAFRYAQEKEGQLRDRRSKMTFVFVSWTPQRGGLCRLAIGCDLELEGKTYAGNKSMIMTPLDA
jgi:hypothetical protein